MLTEKTKTKKNANIIHFIQYKYAPNATSSCKFIVCVKIIYYMILSGAYLITIISHKQQQQYC